MTTLRIVAGILGTVAWVWVAACYAASNKITKDTTIHPQARIAAAGIYGLWTAVSCVVGVFAFLFAFGVIP